MSRLFDVNHPSCCWLPTKRLLVCSSFPWLCMVWVGPISTNSCSSLLMLPNLRLWVRSCLLSRLLLGQWLYNPAITQGGRAR
jgi:hypothetical protein